MLASPNTCGWRRIILFERVDDVGHRELTAFRSDLRVKDDLQQQVAELFTQLFGIALVEQENPFQTIARDIDFVGVNQ